MKVGFDNEKYLQEQSQFILERVKHYDKLYLEFGGKLVNDLHAKRVLPGYDPNVKLRLLQKLKDKAEIIICVYAGDLESNKMHGDMGVPYHQEVLQLIDMYHSLGIKVTGVVITRYDNQPAAKTFINKLNRHGINVYKHAAIDGYPRDVNKIVSAEGYGRNEYVPTTSPIVVVTAPGPGSGKLATCLNQLYHENIRGKVVGYSKFETFPVWNVPLKHPLNLAYEAATADLKDVNMIDSFHLDAYGKVTVNYNRDIEMFPVIKRIIERITGKEAEFKSPTDMGVNRIGFGIIDDDVVKEASKQEIIRRYFKANVDYKNGVGDKEIAERIYSLMNELNLKEEDRRCVKPARDYHERLEAQGNETNNIIAIELPDGTMVTGRSSKLLACSSAALLNALKLLAGIEDEALLLSPNILKPVIEMKSTVLDYKHAQLDCEDVLTMLSILAVSDHTCKLVLSKLNELKGSQAHATAILSQADQQTLRKLGVDVTTDAVYPSNDLYYQ